MEHSDKLVALVTLLLVIVTVASIVATLKIARSQEALQVRLAADQKTLQGQLSTQYNDVQTRISRETERRHEEQRRYEQRAQLIPLWEYLSSLREIDVVETNTAQVVKTVNTLELVALCREAEVVDEAVIMRAFRDKYIILFEAVRKCGPLKGYSRDKTGEDLLAENDAATELYEKLIADRRKRDALPPLKKKGSDI